MTTKRKDNEPMADPDEQFLRKVIDESNRLAFDLLQKEKKSPKKKLAASDLEGRKP